MRISHETIDKSLLIRARGVLAKRLQKHLRSGRPNLHDIHKTVTTRLATRLFNFLNYLHRTLSWDYGKELAEHHRLNRTLGLGVC